MPCYYNGKCYEGKSISVKDGIVKVDGKIVAYEELPSSTNSAKVTVYSSSSDGNVITTSSASSSGGNVITTSSASSSGGNVTTTSLGTTHRFTSSSSSYIKGLTQSTSKK